MDNKNKIVLENDVDLSGKMIIGIIGNKNAGKDTIGQYLCEKFGYTRYAFGDPVKQVCKTIFSLSDEQLNDRKLKETIDPRWDISPRHMFQRIGTEFAQFELFKLFPEIKQKLKYRELWVDVFEKWYQKSENKVNPVVITDVRFKHEVQKIKDLGGIILKVNRNNNANDCHISELELNRIPKNLIDYIIDNNYTIDDLYSQIDTIIYIPF
jgi:hypothetical protein